LLGIADDEGYGTALEGFATDCDFTEDEEDQIANEDDETFRSNFTGVFILQKIEGMQHFMQAMGAPWIVAKSAVVVGFGNTASVEINLVGDHITLVETGGWLAHSVRLNIGAPSSKCRSDSPASMRWDDSILKCSWEPHGTPVQCWRHMQDRNTLISRTWVEADNSTVCMKTWSRV
jgi:hypothetical protein